MSTNYIVWEHVALPLVYFCRQLSPRGTMTPYLSYQ